MPSVVGKMTKGAAFDSLVDAVDVGNIDTLTAKATPVSADLLILADSASSFTRKKLTIGSLPAGTPEGTAILSTGEIGATKFLREDGDGTCSWQAVTATADDTAYNATSWNTNLDAATKNAIRDKIETMDTAISLNTAKSTNVSTALSIGTKAATTMGITSDGGADDVILPAANTTEAGLMTDAQFDKLAAIEALADVSIVEKSITIESPTATEDISIFFTNRAITMTEMRGVLANGTATPSVTWTIRHATDRSLTGNEVVTGGTTTTSVSTGSDVTVFNDATIPADSFVWAETTAQSGTVPAISITLIASID